MKTNYTCGIDPINYDEVASDSSRHLRYYDYKHLKNVDWGVAKQIIISDIMGLCGFILAVVSIIVVLFLGV